MQTQASRGRLTGHVRRVRRKSGDRFYVAYRLPCGRQVQKLLGPAWTSKGRPPEGYFTPRLAEEALQAILTDARRGTLELPTRTGATFADASAEWLRHAEEERDCKHSTMTDYRLMIRRLDAALGERALEELSAEDLERWLSDLRGRGASNRTVQKYLAVLHGILGRAKRKWRLPANVAAEVERPRVRPSGRIEFFSPEEVWALVRKAPSEQDAAIFLAAPFTGLRMGELLALRWRSVDFERRSIRVEVGYTLGVEDSPKSNRSRAVPMAPEVAEALARLGQRDLFVGDGDLVFCGRLGGHLNPERLRERYRCALDAAKLRPLRFHDLRHTFGSIAINRASAVQVKEWMGHADLKTTERYLHFKERGDEADLLNEAFASPTRAIVSSATK